MKGKVNRALEGFSSMINDMDDYLPKGRSRCFDIGMAGGCGVSCGAFAGGECSEPQDIDRDEVIGHYGEGDGEIILQRYE